MMNLDNEKLLVDKAKSDLEAFGKLFDAYYPAILGYSLNRTADVRAAKDITSDVFFKALKKIDGFRWQGVPFSAWLYRIANNCVADYYKRGKIRQIDLDGVPESVLESSPPADAELVAAEEELDRRRQYRELHRHIIKLDSRYQEVITLRFFEDKQINEIAQILGKSENTVKSLLHRGLGRLKTFMI